MYTNLKSRGVFTHFITNTKCSHKYTKTNDYNWTPKKQNKLILLAPGHYYPTILGPVVYKYK